MNNPTPQALYQTVKDYAHLGEHRTGTECDHETARWFARRLHDVGAEVDTQTFSFPRFDATWYLEIGGSPTVALPLFYGPTGVFDLRDVPVRRLDLSQYDEVTALCHLDKLIHQAKGDGASGLIVETVSVTGEVYAMNAHPDWGYDFPVMFVGKQSGGRNRFHLNAQRVDGEADIVVGHLGGRSRLAPLIITTPFSGWFTCAGERGTGIALAIALAATLSENRPVVVIGTSGHEFQYLGSHYYLQSTTIDPGNYVLHLGSSLATLPSLSEGLSGIAHVTSGQFSAMSDCLAMSGITLTCPDDPTSSTCWQGESEHWAPFGCQMMSLAGVSPAFHTPGDTPRMSTSSHLLQEMYEVTLETIERMMVV